MTIMLVVAMFILGAFIGYAIGVRVSLNLLKQCKRTLQQAREENVRARALIKEMDRVSKILEGYS